MSKAIENLKTAIEFAMKNRPTIGGFPFLAETLRQAGVTKNIWTLPSCQSLYLTIHGPVVMQGTPLTTNLCDVPSFNEASLITALRTDQAGKSTFPEFLAASWRAGVVGYDVDFEKRIVTYFGALGEKYIEAYPSATVNA